MDALKGKILLVEDEEVDQLIFKRFIQKEYFPYQVQIANSVSEARLFLQREQFDVVISDYMLSDGTVFDLRRDHLDVPFVLVTGTGSENVAIKAIKSGIQDYIIKDLEGNYLKSLEITLANLIKKRQDEIALHQSRERLEALVAERTRELEAEIAERKRIEAQNSATLMEKEHLLKEVHHRVKNNLQIIYNLLSLQTQYIKDPEAQEIFRESQNRIHSIALVHERLYRARECGKIDFAAYIRNLVQALYQTYHIDRNRIAFDFQGADIGLGIDQAIPCGLILNELVSNSLKHAFPSGYSGPGSIVIFFKKTGLTEIELVVSDNGIGFSQFEKFDKPQTLGLRLVRLLVEEQLQGTIKMFSEKGTKYLINFCV